MEEARVDDLEAAAAHEDGAPAAAVRVVARRVAVHEREILYREGRRVLIVAVAGGPHLPFVARVLIENADAPATAERDLSAAVDHDLGPLVVEDLRRAVNRDDDRRGPTIEGNDPTERDGGDERVRGAACGCPSPDDGRRVRNALEQRLGGYNAVTLGIARGRDVVRIRMRVAAPAAEERQNHEKYARAAPFSYHGTHSKLSRRLGRFRDVRPYRRT